MGSEEGGRAQRSAESVGRMAEESGMTVAVAESLTGGLLASCFARAPGSSGWFRGGVVAYSRSVKHGLLGVPPGPVVSEQSAVAMAEGAARVLESDIAVSVTGVGGPDDQDGQPPGTVWVATFPARLGPAVRLNLEGDPTEICQSVCERATALLEQRLQLLADVQAPVDPDQRAGHEG